jgi:hypothetical protein
MFSLYLVEIYNILNSLIQLIHPSLSFISFLAGADEVVVFIAGDQARHFYWFSVIKLEKT